ncbi:MAG: LPS assembly protein LptD [Bacteroidetes bacterium]|nr:LPS assembly protein LptD [Bacteroidota bacterium]
MFSKQWIVLLVLVFVAVATNSSPGLAAEGDIGFEADSVNVNQDDGSMLATGNVIMQQAGMELRADEVTYDRDADIAVARGNVIFTDKNGTTHRSNVMTLDTEFSHIVAETLRTRFVDGTFFTAEDGDVVIDEQSMFNTSRFSPCNCDFENGETPIWDLRATSTRHDAKTKTIVHANVRMHIMNIPVGYLPYLAHPDWTVRRRTGFLAPSFVVSTDLGFTSWIPYYVVLGDTNDIEFTPYNYQHRGKALKTLYRQRWDDSDLGLTLYTASVNTYKKKREGVAALDASFNTTIGDNWKVRARALRASQDTFLRRYKFINDTWLKSEISAERFKKNRYYLVEASDTQNLSSGKTPDKEPTVLPHIFYENLTSGFRPSQTLRTEISAIQLDNDEGHDMSRWVGNVELHDRLTDGALKTDVRASLIGRYYSIQKKPATATTKTDDLGRVNSAASIGWRYPLAVSSEQRKTVIEPQIQLVHIGGRDQASEIPNRDSADYRIDSANLFLLNRYQGYDYLRPGSRADAGVSALARDSLLGDVSGFIGISRRISGKPSAGLAVNDKNTLSDYVVSLSVNPPAPISLSWSGRMSPHDYKMNEARTVIKGSVSRIEYNFEHMQLAKPYFSSAASDLEEFKATLTADMGKGWSVTGSQVWDLSNGKTVRDKSTAAMKWTGGLQDCLTVNFGYDRDMASDRDIAANDAFLITINFKYLGSISQTDLFKPKKE